MQRRVASHDAPGGFNPGGIGVEDGIEIPMSLNRRYATKIVLHSESVG